MQAGDPVADEPLTAVQIETVRTLSPLPEVPRDPTNAVSKDAGAAHLGRFLFFEQRLSADGSVSCASCHRPNHGFSVPTRVGHGLEKTPRHPPSLLNIAYHEWYDWDGKADSVFGSLSDLSSKERFPPKARPDPDDPESAAHRAWQSMAEADRKTVNRVASNMTKAIAAYEEKLVSGGAPFDRYVEGLETGDPAKLDALSPSAKRGLKLFVGEAQCINCHNGPALTDRAFHNLGLGPRPWLPDGDQGRWKGVPSVKSNTFNAAGAFSDAPEGKAADWVRYLKRTSEDHGQFKTPTLRNVELTPPYMHGGHFSTLEEVVRFYSTLDEQPRVGHREEMLEPLGLSDREVDDLVAFLKSLTGREVPAKLRRPPVSPVPEDGANQ
ncbi:MAG: cytochrome-c peroxidase [Bradymonadaceae bacterium]